MNEELSKVSTDELEKARSLLRVHVLACKIYQLAEEATYYDGQPVGEAKETASNMIEHIDIELDRRKHAQAHDDH